MNCVNLLGNLCRDNDIRYAGGENANAVIRNTIAVPRRFKNKATGQYDSDFISIVAFGQTAEFISKYFSKGSKIAVTGHIQTGDYTDKDGVKHYTTDVVVDQVDFASSKNDAAPNNQQKPNVNDFVNEGIDVDSLNAELPFH